MSSAGLAIPRVAGGDVTLLVARERAAWDEALASIPGTHPLQSWGWGAAKESVGEDVVRLVAGDSDAVLGMAQIALRRTRGVRWAWVSRGPVCAELPESVRRRMARAFARFLAARHVRLLVARPYIDDVLPEIGWRVPSRHPERTFRIDLTQPEDVLERRFDKRFKRNRDLLRKAGGTVVEVRSADAIEPLIALYESSTARKGFAGYGDAQFMRAVWKECVGSAEPDLTGQLFHAVHGGVVVGATLVLRSRTSGHYLWGAFDYEKRALRASEALHWAIIVELRRRGVTYYDLEGADQRNNPGVYEFKSRLGGDLIELPPLRWRLLV